jgi:hypothetical protein
MRSFIIPAASHFAILITASTLSAADAALVLRNGRIWTGDPQRPWVEAIAIQGNKIAAVGTNAEIAPHVGRATKLVDLAANSPRPDSTTRTRIFLDGSLQLSQSTSSTPARSKKCKRRIAAYAKSHPDAKWITWRGMGIRMVPRASSPY